LFGEKRWCFTPIFGTNSNQIPKLPTSPKYQKRGSFTPIFGANSDQIPKLPKSPKYQKRGSFTQIFGANSKQIPNFQKMSKSQNSRRIRAKILQKIKVCKFSERLVDYRVSKSF